MPPRFKKAAAKITSVNLLRRKIQQWLSPLDPSLNHNAACEARHDGTAGWFLEGAIYMNGRRRALSYGPTGIVRFSNANARDMNTVTPLHKAIEREIFDIAQLLINHGANVNAFVYRSGHQPRMAKSRSERDNFFGSATWGCGGRGGYPRQEQVDSSP